MTQFPAGWYPSGDGQMRYWDGQNWTQQTAPAQPGGSAPSAPSIPGGPGNQGEPIQQYAPAQQFPGADGAQGGGGSKNGVKIAIIAARTSSVAKIASAIVETSMLPLMLAGSGMSAAARLTKIILSTAIRSRRSSVAIGNTTSGMKLLSLKMTVHGE